MTGIQRATPEFSRCFSQQCRRRANLSTLETTKQIFKDKLPAIVFTSMVGICGSLAYGIHAKRTNIARLEYLVKATQKFNDETDATVGQLNTF